MTEPKGPDCFCGLPVELSRLPSSPIVFDEELTEFRLRFQNGSLEQLMIFCFWCGGKLPCSERGSLFEGISESESADIQIAISGVQSISDAIRVLGKPDDEIRSSTASESPYMSLFYNRRWKTCDLCIFSDDTQAFNFAIVPKRKALQ